MTTPRPREMSRRHRMTKSRPPGPGLPLEPDNNYPILKAPVVRITGNGKDWSWGAWEREKVELINGVEVSTFDAGSVINGKFLEQNFLLDLVRNLVRRNICPGQAPPARWWPWAASGM